MNVSKSDMLFDVSCTQIITGLKSLKKQVYKISKRRSNNHDFNLKREIYLRRIISLYNYHTQRLPYVTIKTCFDKK